MSIDDRSLIVQLGDGLYAPPLDHLNRGLVEVASAVKVRDAVLDIAAGFKKRIDDVRKTRSLTDHERASLRIRAAATANGQLGPIRKVILEAHGQIDERKAMLKPAAQIDVSDTVMQADLAIGREVAGWDKVRRGQFLDELREGPITARDRRYAEAIFRNGNPVQVDHPNALANIVLKNGDEFAREIHAVLHESANGPALAELRDATSAVNQTTKFLGIVEEAIRVEVVHDRAAAVPEAA